MPDDSAISARLPAPLSWLRGPREDLSYYVFFLAAVASALVVRYWLDEPDLTIVADRLLTIALIYGALRTIFFIVVLPHLGTDPWPFPSASSGSESAGARLSARWSNCA